MKDMLWHSNAVVERVAYNQVKTSSGNIYLLQGHIDSVWMRKEGKKIILKESCRIIAAFCYLARTAKVNVGVTLQSGIRGL